MKKLSYILASLFSSILILGIAIFMTLSASFLGFIFFIIFIFTVKVYIIRSWFDYQRNKDEVVR